MLVGVKMDLRGEEGSRKKVESANPGLRRSELTGSEDLRSSSGTIRERSW